jgi:hypothetical membrane protein
VARQQTPHEEPRLPAWGEIAFASAVTAILLLWLHAKDRFRSIGAAIVIGAVTVFLCLVVTGGPISHAIEDGITQVALLIFLLVTAGGWAVEKIRRPRKKQ